MKNIIFFLLPFISSTFAAVFIECGDLNSSQKKITNLKYTFFSSTGVFEGTVGNSWNMASGDKWFGKNPNIKAIVTTADEVSTLTITSMKSEMPPVGVGYKITDIYGEPELQVSNFGGFTGYVVTERMYCITKTH